MKKLMTIINYKKLFIKSEYQPLFNEQNGWLDRKKYSVLLKKEIRRSYRSNLPLSQVVIKFQEKTASFKKNGGSAYDRFFSNLAEIISENSREIDLKSLVQPGEIEILLVDTSIQGAKLYIEKILTLITERAKSVNEDHYGKLSKNLTFSSHQINQISGRNKIESEPAVIGRGDVIKDADGNSEVLFEQTDISKLDFFPALNGTVSISSSSLLDTISFDGFGKAIDKVVTRIFNILGALTGIIIFSPLMLIISIAIKLSSKGPVLFMQKRMGYLGEQFTFLKFRTMRVDTDDKIHQEYVRKLIEGQNSEINSGTQQDPVYKIKNDPRITTIGRFLRKTSLDELPQFFNVLSGKMSLVGPRPPIPYEVESYKRWHLRRILEVKPGITGVWQVNGRSMTTFDEMVRMDLQYVAHRSIYLDIKLVVQTFGAVFNSKGAM
ncbi:MAG: sugar transferase [Calditrichaceae bacterium]